MATPTPLTDAERDRIRQLHTTGKSCRAIAGDLGRSPSAVAKAARGMGLTWGAERTAAATEAKQASNREKRANLETRLLDEALGLLVELHEPHLVYNFGGKDNTYEEHQLDRPDVGAKRALIGAAGTAITHALKLAAVDAGQTGAAEGKGILGRLDQALSLAYGQLGPGSPADDEGPATS